MQRYILSRCLQAVLTLLGVSIVIFLLSRVLGDPVHLFLPVEANAEAQESFRKALGLDKPIYVQYGIFLSHAVRGDLGTSLKMGQPVSHLISQRLPYSLALGTLAMFFNVLIAFPLGMLAAVKKGTPWDAAARIAGFLGQSVPSFWLGIVLIIVFSLKLGWLPASGTGGIAYYILPALALCGVTAAGMLRLLRSSMLEVLDSDYLRFARSKGLSERVVVWKHALRNALIPVVTFGGLSFALLIGMAVAVESIFGWPGIGRLAYEAVIWRDYSVIQGVVLTIAAIIVIVNLAVDLVYGYIDPRIRDQD